MAVTVKTVKKKPLSLKKGASKAPQAEGAEGAEGAPDGAAAAAPAAAAPSVAKAKEIKKPSYVFSGICAILTFLMFCAILTLQYLEWKHYYAPKPVFWVFGELGVPIPTGGANSSSEPVEVVDENDMAPVDDEPMGDAPVDDGAAPVENDISVE